MAVLRLSDGRVVTVRRATDIQLVADTDFGGSRQRPVIVDVTELDGQRIAVAKLAILDCHSIWLSHQAEIAPRSPRGPAVPTGLTAAEAVPARALFLKLIGGGPATIVPTPPPVEKPTGAAHKPWWRDTVLAIAVPVVVAIILAWLGLAK